jgi:uncharacterized circularly permuted ATP-grasp superfamily protein
MSRPMPWDEAAVPLDGHDPADLAARARSAMDEAGVTFGSLGDERFLLDPVPRVLSAAEWEPLAAGLAQRVRALDAFCADAYGARRIVADGVVPERVIETAEAYEPVLQGLSLPLWVGIAGLDVVRDPDGRFLVLEDNLRTPSGMAYAVAARSVVSALFAPASLPAPLDGLVPFLSRALSAVSVGGRAVVLTDGPDNSAYWEHGWLARELGVPLVTPADLSLDGDRLTLGGEPVGAVYRRTNEDRVETDTGRLLLRPWRAGRVGLLNAFGTGVGDDKLAHAYVEDMVRYYLGEEPLVRSVRTFDLAVVLEEALDCFEELVIKPRAGYGGEGVVICPHAERADVERMREAVRAAPSEFVAQELVPLSCHATVVDGQVVPRHVDLRPFVFLDGTGGAQVLPGGLTRVALDEGALVVNSSQNGGAKDTWVIG